MSPMTKAYIFDSKVFLRLRLRFYDFIIMQFEKSPLLMQSCLASYTIYEYINFVVQSLFLANQVLFTIILTVT